MRNDILIISDQLVEPPTESLAFRTITMMAHDNLSMDVLLHTTQDMKDIYFGWMKPKGMLDYIEYLLNEMENEDGIRLDIAHNFPRTIVVEAITLDNQLNILGQLRWLTNIE